MLVPFQKTEKTEKTDKTQCFAKEPLEKTEKRNIFGNALPLVERYFSTMVSLVVVVASGHQRLYHLNIADVRMCGNQWEAISDGNLIPYCTFRIII